MGVYADMLQTDQLNRQRQLLEAQQRLAAQQAVSSGGGGTPAYTGTAVSPTFGQGTVGTVGTTGAGAGGATTSGGSGGGGALPLVSPAGLPSVGGPPSVQAGQSI